MMTPTFIERLKRTSIRHVAAVRGCLRLGFVHELPDRPKSISPTETSFLGKMLATTAPSDEPTFTVDLPVELWLTILSHIADRATLAVLAQVSRMFSYEAEAHLYHTITFDFDPAIYRFCKSIVAVPRRAELVTGFHLMAIENAYGSTLHVLLPVLRSLRNLEYLTLNISMGSGPDVYEEQRKLKAILSLRFPFLRSFATNGALTAQPQSLDFVQAHPFLEELEFNGSYHEAWAQGISSTHPPSLRILACRSWFLHDNRPIPNTLTHFHATSLHPAGLDHIARLLGKRLVSLRISHCVPFVFHHFDPMSLDGVASRFPRLRFLQLDMEHRAKPYINKHPLSFAPTRPTRRSDSDSARDTARLGPGPGRPHARFTLALVYSRPQTHAVDMTVAAAWHEFLNRTALQVLRGWDDCVARVVYRHTIIPYVSVALGGDGTRLVRKQDRQMRDDEWKLV